MPLVLQRVTGSVKTDGRSSEGTGRRSKKMRTESRPEGFEVTVSQVDVQNQSFPEGEWSQPTESQGQDYSVVGQNVDPGLQMPQGS